MTFFLIVEEELGPDDDVAGVIGFGLRVGVGLVADLDENTVGERQLGGLYERELGIETGAAGTLKEALFELEIAGWRDMRRVGGRWAGQDRRRGWIRNLAVPSRLFRSRAGWTPARKRAREGRTGPPNVRTGAC